MKGSAGASVDFRAFQVSWPVHRWFQVDLVADPLL